MSKLPRLSGREVVAALQRTAVLLPRLAREIRQGMAVREAVRRDEELSAGTVGGRTHEEVMQAARRAIGCG